MDWRGPTHLTPFAFFGTDCLLEYAFSADRDPDWKYATLRASKALTSCFTHGTAQGSLFPLSNLLCTLRLDTTVEAFSSAHWIGGAARGCGRTWMASFTAFLLVRKSSAFIPRSRMDMSCVHRPDSNRSTQPLPRASGRAKSPHPAKATAFAISLTAFSDFLPHRLNASKTRLSTSLPPGLHWFWRRRFPNAATTGWFAGRDNSQNGPGAVCFGETCG